MGGDLDNSTNHVEQRAQLDSDGAAKVALQAGWGRRAGEEWMSARARRPERGSARWASSHRCLPVAIDAARAANAQLPAANRCLLTMT